MTLVPLRLTYSVLLTHAMATAEGVGVGETEGSLAMGSRVLSLSSWDTVQTFVAPCEAVEQGFRARALGTRWTWVVPVSLSTSSVPLAKSLNSPTGKERGGIE